MPLHSNINTASIIPYLPSVFVHYSCAEKGRSFTVMIRNIISEGEKDYRIPYSSFCDCSFQGISQNKN